MTQDMHVYGFKKRATSKMNRSTHTLSILLEQLRSSLEAGKKQLRSSLEAGKRQSGVRLVTNEVTARRQRDYGSLATRLRLVIITLLALMTFGATNALAQTNYSGTYYIRSTGKNASITNLYYLCPTENWYFYEATNKYAETDNGYPFLTTYKIKAHDDYDISKAVWGIEKHPSETDCYYIKQLKTGKYLVSNGQITGSSNANRVRVHLEAVADAAALTALGDMALFEITADGDHLDILPHAADGRNGNNKYLVVNNGNYDQLDAQNSKTDFVNGKYGKGTGGIIGLYEHEDNAKFWLEKTVMPPTITYDEATGTATITATINGKTVACKVTVSEPKDVREDFVDKLLDCKDFWYYSDQGDHRTAPMCGFIDLDLDGNKEFIVQVGGGTLEPLRSFVYYYDNGEIKQAEGEFQNVLTLYYDTKQNKYRMMNNFYSSERVNVGSTFNAELFYANHKVQSYVYTAGYYSIEQTWTYYLLNKISCVGEATADNKVISKEEYDQINNDLMDGLVNANMKTKFSNRRDWQNYSTQQVREALLESYDAFSYDSFE